MDQACCQRMNCSGHPGLKFPAWDTADGEFRISQRKDISYLRVLYVHIVSANLFHYLPVVLVSLATSGMITVLLQSSPEHYPSADVVCVRMAEKKVIQFPDPFAPLR